MPGAGGLSEVDSGDWMWEVWEQGARASLGFQRGELVDNGITKHTVGKGTECKEKL